MFPESHFRRVDSLKRSRSQPAGQLSKWF
uniref:Uncharacterized protein n=1 Tax=Anguilla anguilla TaxID=7936 RepID=A0A0E9PI85_ANGAN